MFTFTPLPHEEAVRRIAELPLVSREVMDEMLPELRAYAFTITGLDVGDQMAKVRDVIAAVPAGAQTWEKARRAIAAELVDDLGGKASQRRAELLLRTHVFRAYAASRYRRLMQQIDVFPYWQYKTHGDGNVRPSHAALNGKIFPAGHDIWQRIFPPWDWGCRCLVVPLTKAGMERMMAQSGEQRAESQKDGHLLPTQIAKPEVFTDREATLIDKNQRLPDGKPLNRTPTWADAPWSIPGNIQHDWKLIKARYDDQPEVLAAFEAWAKKTEISKGVTVSQWIGEGKASAKKAVKKAAVKALKPTIASLSQSLQAEIRAAGAAADATVNFKGADLAVAQQMNDVVLAHLRDFPALAQRFDFIGTNAAQGDYIRERFLAEAQHYADLYWSNSSWPQDEIDRRKREMIDRYLSRKITRMPKASAFYSARGKGKDILVMNKKGANPIAAEIAAMDRAVTSGWWPKTIQGTPPGAHITTHELGHAMDALLGLRRQPELLDLWRNRVSQFSRAEAADQLSIYGTTNIAEMIAEAWTEYRHAPTPRPLAVEIGRLIERAYNSQFPATV
jgi:SPP1 gp7 family putative phage head morphogenesis protein